MKHQYAYPLILFMAVVFLFGQVVPAHAFDINNILESLPSPLRGFIDSVQKTITVAAPHAPSLKSIKNIDFKSLEPNALLTNLKTWLADKGGGIAGIIKRAGAFFADILSYIANFLRRALMLLP
jgi:hypothetical protein